MIHRIKEIKDCLDKNLYEAALALTLTLPDICAQVEYPNIEFVGDRYKKWIEDFVDMSNLGDDASYHRIMSCFDQSVTAENYPRLTVENLYKLRCNFLHSGNIEIKSSFFQEFCLMKPESMGFVKNNLPAEWKIIHTTNGNNDAVYRIEIDVKHLCLTICNAAEKYYNTKNSNDFINHTMEIR